jgi:hypothetical protein
MTIKMKIKHYKYEIKQWISEHKALITAVISTSLLAAMIIYSGSQMLANFIDKEFIQPAVAKEINLNK